MLTTFGVIVKKKLAEKNLTLNEVAYKLEINRTYLSQIMHGKRSGDKYINQIKKFLEIE